MLPLSTASKLSRVIDVRGQDACCYVTVGEDCSSGRKGGGHSSTLSAGVIVTQVQGRTWAASH